MREETEKIEVIASPQVIYMIVAAAKREGLRVKDFILKACSYYAMRYGKTEETRKRGEEMYNYVLRKAREARK